MVIPVIIGSFFLEKRNPYSNLTFQDQAVTFPAGTTISFLPLDIRPEYDIFNRYYLELGNPNPLSGIV